MEIEYQEIFEKTINKDYLNTLLKEMANTYRSDLGWLIGEMKTTELSDSQIKISIPLTKYKLNQNDDIYREIFTRKTLKSNVEYLLLNIRDTYTEEKGWRVGEPTIVDLGNGEVLLQVHLEKRNLGISR